MKLNIFGYIGLGLFVVGAVMLVFAIRAHRKNQAFIIRAFAVDGKVTELIREDDWSDCRRVRMEFKYNGENHFYIDGPHCPAEYKIGEPVSLFFIPSENSVFINDFSHRWVTAVMLGVPAAFLILLGAVFFFMAGIDKK